MDHSPETEWGKRDGQERTLFSGGRVKSPVAKAIYAEQGVFVTNDVIAMRTANSFAQSTDLDWLGRVWESGLGMDQCVKIERNYELVRQEWIGIIYDENAALNRTCRRVIEPPSKKTEKEKQSEQQRLILLNPALMCEPLTVNYDLKALLEGTANT